jgi:hypothetical protein
MTNVAPVFGVLAALVGIADTIPTSGTRLTGRLGRTGERG